MMNDPEINKILLRNAMDLAATNGWHHVSLVQVAQQADIPIDTARQLFPCKLSLLLYLNRLADEYALEQKYQGQPTSDYLFDIFMSRFDIFQEYRAGFISILHTLPLNPALTVIMGFATQNSMRQIANAAHIHSQGLRGIACIKGLSAIWTFTMRTWVKDDSPDLAQTMATLDQTIKKARKFAPYFTGKTTSKNEENQYDNPDESFNQ